MDVDEFFVPTTVDSLVPILQQYGDANPTLSALSIRHWIGGPCDDEEDDGKEGIGGGMGGSVGGSVGGGVGVISSPFGGGGGMISSPFQTKSGKEFKEASKGKEKSSGRKRARQRQRQEQQALYLFKQACTEIALASQNKVSFYSR
jgi:hypothetical protein